MRGVWWQRERRRVQRKIVVPAVVAMAVLVGVTSLLSSVRRYDPLETRRRVPRSVSSSCLAPKEISDNSSSDFPPDLFSLEQRRKGAVVLHLGGLVYMFVALAVVCDEFFVPSLSVLIEKLDISSDVAGATFMAAGGSAPEFFTSVFGVFVAQNNVGIGTIVGSATFNILCVLAFCTLFSREVLHLTWWPLFRDMSFYIVALLFLVIFFSDEKISWHEALTMFLLYIIYGLFMKYNSQLEMLTKQWLKSNSTSAIQTQAVCRLSVEAAANREHRRSIPMIHGGMREGIAQMAIGSDEESEMDHEPTVYRQKTVTVRPANDRIFVNTANPVSSISHHGDCKASNGNNKIAPVEITQLTNNDRRSRRDLDSAETTTSTISASMVTAENGNSIHIPPLAIDTLSIGSNSSEHPLDLSFPDTWCKRAVFLSLAPIMFPLAATLPDVRRPGRRRWFLLTFVGSILWIAFFSYLMVWWANTIGETLAIPTEIMGLTVLAAGTSIPDLITSVIVARKGLGDMAVSSSIGSNLFDISIGLPIPWLLYFLVALFKRAPGPFPTISVVSNGLICSVGMLFLMLVFLVISIALSNWRMNKSFGLAMIVSYVVFCLFSIFLETGLLNCPLRLSQSCR